VVTAGHGKGWEDGEIKMTAANIHIRKNNHNHLHSQSLLSVRAFVPML